MNEVDVKELVDVGQRTALLLGEVTGRLIMILGTSYEDTIAMGDDIESLLKVMRERISSIYYEGK